MSFMSLLSSNPREYSLKDSAFLVTRWLYLHQSVLRGVSLSRVIFFFFFRFVFVLRTQRPAVSTMHSFKNLPSERGLLAFANLKPSKKLPW